MSATRNAIFEQTHGNPPDRACLPGSDEKWEGYLLGVDEAGIVAESLLAEAVAEHDELRRELDAIQTAIMDDWQGRESMPASECVRLIMAERDEMWRQRDAAWRELQAAREERDRLQDRIDAAIPLIERAPHSRQSAAAMRVLSARLAAIGEALKEPCDLGHES